MRKVWMVGVLGVVAVAAIAASFVLGRAKQSDVDKTKVVAPLEFTQREIVRPTLTPLPLKVEFSGPLVAPSTAVVKAKTNGTLLSLNVNEGSRVKAGESLGKVDLSELGSRVAERVAMLESAKAALAQAERTHASNVRLADQKFISSSALDTSQAAVDTARANFRAAQAQLDTTQVSLRDAALISPISGVVAKRYAVPGEKLSAEQQIFSIVDLQTLELAGSVGTHQVSMLSPGMPVDVKVEGVDEVVRGKIARISPTAEAGTRSIGVTITMANPKETFRAGQYAVATVTLADNADRLTVPMAAVANSTGQDNVWVIENGALMRRAVTTGRRDDASGRIEVLEGLQPGAQVLAARFENLREGSKAVVVQKSASVASAAASVANLK